VVPNVSPHAYFATNTDNSMASATSLCSRFFVSRNQWANNQMQLSGLLKKNFETIFQILADFTDSSGQRIIVAYTELIKISQLLLCRMHAELASARTRNPIANPCEIRWSVPGKQ
jgi:hypothetical protein